MKARGRLTRAFFDARPTVELARALIGCCLVHDGPGGLSAGRIVETEAYLAEGDPASHSHGGRTARNGSMFARPGTAYVYLIYGLHHCLNVVSAAEGVGEAVLLRALEPLAGEELMVARRGVEKRELLCSGPGKLAQALGVTRAQDGADLCRAQLGLWQPRAFGAWNPPSAELVSSSRVGITKAAQLPLRFHLAGSPWVSR